MILSCYVDGQWMIVISNLWIYLYEHSYSICIYNSQGEPIRSLHTHTQEYLADSCLLVDCLKETDQSQCLKLSSNIDALLELVN